MFSSRALNISGIFSAGGHLSKRQKYWALMIIEPFIIVSALIYTIERRGLSSSPMAALIFLSLPLFGA